MDPTPNQYPISPEEQIDAFAALALLQEFYAKGAEEDEAHMEHRLSLLHNNVRLEMRPYLQLCVPGDEDAPMACNYYQMVLRPEQGSVARKKVSEIVARFPYYDSSEQPYDLPEDVDRWNDVSLEVKYADGITNRYWLNGKGLTPYKDADALDFDYPRVVDGTDLFAVQPGMEDTDARHLTGTELRMLLRQSEAKTQPNTPEEN